MDPRTFYDDIASVFHHVYADWPASVRRQGAALDGILHDALGPGPHRLLDVSCGIGTQALGLAELGHEVIASDVSSAAITRARSEAQRRGLSISFSVADMRSCDSHHLDVFDSVLSADNSVPHLLSDDEILKAFRAFYNCTRPGGVVLITVRDYAREDRSSPQLRPYGVRRAADGRWIVFQVWEFEGDLYDMSMYFVHEPDHGQPEIISSRTRYYAVDTDTLIRLLRKAGFDNVERIDGRYFQPVLLGRRPPA